LLAMTNGLVSLKLNDLICRSGFGDEGLNSGKRRKFVLPLSRRGEEITERDIDDRIPLSPPRDIVIVPPDGPRSAPIGSPP
jgi:hypothetical protein